MDSRSGELANAGSASAGVAVATARRTGKPWRILVVVAAVMLAAIGGYAWHVYGSEETDDAQIEADVVPITARVGGVIAAVLVRDNQRVHAGDVIARIDDVDYAAHVRQARAELAAAQAGLRRAEAELAKRESDLARVAALHRGDAASQQQLDDARLAVEETRAALAKARADVTAAAAGVDLAEAQWDRTRVTSPTAGFVSDLAAVTGATVQAGQPLARLVPNTTYVVANFKETQIGGMRPGQRAVIRVDAYDGREFAGEVESLSAGTGARFSLLPPDNASGNFVKVVQRVPVRIRWKSPPDLPMRAGLSVDVTVFVHP